jgi:Family of unknown function (DUF6134)
MPRRERLLPIYALLLSAAATAHAAEPARSWNFRVFLDKDPIGFHNFTVTAQGEARELQSDAHFAVKILFINAYHYDHRATEHWRGDCLTQLDSNSDDDGKILAVHALSDAQQLNVEAPKGHYSVSGCAMTFAYWNPVMLQQTHLINPETGEDLPVTITQRGEEDIPVRNATVHARHYHLQGPKMEIDLWYSAQGDWLALESLAEKGRRIRYVLN